MVDKRRTHRTPLGAPVLYRRKGDADASPGRARDISVGGVFVETATPFPFGTEIIVHVHLPGQKDELALQGLVRWTGADGMGLQFGLLGARETHAITELVQKKA
jgi:type IV pilus assembly protein PilZ